MSLPDTRSARRRGAEMALLLARLILGGLFLYMGISKSLDPVNFLKLVRQYEMVDSSWLLNLIAATLPWFEAFCGLLLLAGVAVRGSALVAVLMLVPFTGLVLRRALAIQATTAIPFCSIRFDCGCGAGEVYICHKLIENISLILLSVLLLRWPGRQWCLRFQLWR